MGTLRQKQMKSFGQMVLFLGFAWKTFEPMAEFYTIRLYTLRPQAVKQNGLFKANSIILATSATIR